MRLIFLLPLFALFACDQERTPTTENLTEDQIDSLASELTFNYGEPIELLNSELVVIPIGNRVANWYKSGKSMDYRSSEMFVNWNLLFYDRANDSTYLLTEEKMYLTRVDTPESSSNVKNHIIYEVISNDSNGDNKLNYGDAKQLYISGLDGSNFNKITSDKESLEQYDFSRRENEIYFKTLIDSNNDNEFDNQDTEQWYVINLEKNSKPKAIIDSVAQNKIGKLFVKNWIK